MRRATVSVKWQRDTFSPWECLASMSSFKEILKSKNLRLWVFRSCPLWRLKLLERKWKGEKADLCNCSFHSVSRVWLFCDTMECRPPGSSDHGIFQAKILEWVAISFSRGSSQSRVWTYVSCSDRQILFHWATWEALLTQRPCAIYLSLSLNILIHKMGFISFHSVQNHCKD